MVFISEPLTRTVPVETPDIGELRSRIRRSGRHTVGVEEEFILVDGAGMPTAEAARIARRVEHDDRLRTELPDCQIELATPPRSSLELIERDLRRGRAAAAGWCDGVAIPISAAVHPFVAETEVAGLRAADVGRRYGWLARSQLLGALQVHVAVGDPDVIVPVHDELRSYLPLITGLAAAAPFREGRDLGMASVRPFISSLLPRQGIPPAFATLDAYVDALSWLVGSGVADDPTEWWWDLRIHPTYGTLEVRVADAQPTTRPDPCAHSIAAV
ncbi:MAG TPA: glutamate-cysteine ligase family protein [Acidimicrobiales bacterium]|nr:glutamate-cysteine ligase family protein [Acidimicrobiales bacterium]